MSGEYGIKETKEAVAAFIGIGNALGKALEDGKIGLTDAPHFIAAAMKIPAGISGWKSIPAELGDLDDTERTEILEFAKSEFDIPQDKIEAIVEDALALAQQNYQFIQKHFLKKAA